MDAVVAGPSRLPTISTEDEEMAAETGVAVAQADGVKAENGSAPPEQPIPADPNASETVACETLYIQNLNEKVQVEGGFSAWTKGRAILTASDEAYPTESVQDVPTRSAYYRP